MSASASADLLRLLAALAETPTQSHREYSDMLGLAGPADIDGWHVAHAAAFIEQCPPYASMMVSEQGHIGGEAADRVAGFRRLLGSEIGTAPDTLAALLHDYAELVQRATDDPRAEHARIAMLWEHLLAWIMPYLDAMQRSVPAPYDAWAAMLRDVFMLEAEATTRPAALPLHLRMAPDSSALADADTIDAAIQALLTPAATGIVLTRADLARAVAALEAGLVQNSRAFIVKHLLDQDAAATLDWLATEAYRQARARQHEQDALGDVATFWAERATKTARTLTRMASQARDDAATADTRIRQSA